MYVGRVRLDASTRYLLHETCVPVTYVRQRASCLAECVPSETADHQKTRECASIPRRHRALGLLPQWPGRRLPAHVSPLQRPAGDQSARGSVHQSSRHRLEVHLTPALTHCVPRIRGFSSTTTRSFKRASTRGRPHVGQWRSGQRTPLSKRITRVRLKQ